MDNARKSTKGAAGHKERWRNVAIRRPHCPKSAPRTTHRTAPVPHREGGRECGGQRERSAPDFFLKPPPLPRGRVSGRQATHPGSQMGVRKILTRCNGLLPGGVSHPTHGKGEC